MKTCTQRHPATAEALASGNKRHTGPITPFDNFRADFGVYETLPKKADNSVWTKETSQLQAHAYAPGSDIHIAAGQEAHLPQRLTETRWI